MTPVRIYYMYLNLTDPNLQLLFLREFDTQVMKTVADALEILQGDENCTLDTSCLQ